MKRLLSELVGYALVSAAALAIDVAILYLLVEVAGWYYLLAATCSFMTGAFFAYFLSTRLVFRYRRLSDRRLEFAAFAGIGLVGLAINAVAIYTLVEFCGAQYMIAKGAAAILTFSANFLMRRWALFSPSVISSFIDSGNA
jgi:putative flippase GtrA